VTVLTVGAGMAAAVTENGLEALPLAVVTVMVAVPVTAVAATLTGRLIEVAVTVAAPLVIPALLKLTVAPVKFAPKIVTV
jgi:hypothetical protein